MLAQQEIDRIRDFITHNDGFTIIAHVSPDGDTLGSSLALLGMLLQMGKAAEAVCSDRIPPQFAALPLAETIRLPKEAVGYAHAIAVDCADQSRMGSACCLFDGAESTYVIDHHFTNTGYGAYNAVDPRAAATGELIYRLSQSLGLPLNAGIASCLYTALMTDTGNFSYSNTTGDTLRIAGALLEGGADGYELNLHFFRSRSLARLKVLGKAIEQITLHGEGQIGITSLSRAQIQACGAQEEDTEGVVDYVRDIDSVEIAIFLKETGQGVWKASLRAKRKADVGALAAGLGGGGHARAAGYTAHGDRETVLGQALALAQEALS